jgi:putative tricarboxylic transport membrane protein
VGVLMGALLIHGVSPGPLLPSERPDLFWGVITSMFIGNVMLIVLNVPLISLFVRLLRVPFTVLSPIVILFCMIGAYSLNSNPVDVVLMVGFGVVGWLLRKIGFDPAPLLLAFILGSIFERSVRQTLLISRGSAGFLLERPIALAGILIATGVLLWPLLRPRRPTVAAERNPATQQSEI